MKPDKQRLIRDLLADDNRREATLFTGARILRRRRQWRAARRGLALTAILILALVGMERIEEKTVRPAILETAAPQLQSSASAQAQSLTDEELLKLFPNTPVGLTTLANGRKRLIFPRAGDEQKFITRL